MQSAFSIKHVRVYRECCLSYAQLFPLLFPLRGKREFSNFNGCTTEVCELISTTRYDGCNYLSTLGLKFISKKEPQRCKDSWQEMCFSTSLPRFKDMLSQVKASKQHKRKHQCSASPTLCEYHLMMAGSFPTWRAINAESVLMSWRQHFIPTLAHPKELGKENHV